MQKFLKRETDTIFVMLGSGCNLHCQYCLQQCQDIPKLPSKINPEIYDFIRECAEQNAGNPVGIQFYGGEPLLYFDKIHEIVKNTESFNVTYSTITNGKLLSEKMVQFFNEHNFAVTISWDGPHVMETRHYDVLKSNKDNIMALQSLGLSAVLSAKSYPAEVLQAFYEKSLEYEKMHGGQRIGMNLDFVFDTGIVDKSLISDIDYKRMYKDSYDVTKDFLSAMKKGTANSSKYQWQTQCFQTIKECFRRGQNEDVLPVVARCDNGYSVLNMDLAGNLYACHNIFEPVGDIHTPYIQYIKEIIKRDNTIHQKDDCKDCCAMPACRGGCKLLKPGTEEKHSYCKIRWAIFEGVTDAYMEEAKLN